MPKLSQKPPKLSRHSSGRAYITSDGQRVYLGKWNDPATHDAYEKIVDLWETMGGRLPNHREWHHRAWHHRHDGLHRY